VRDYGGRAQHLTTVASQAIVQAYYGRKSKYSYFFGYSRGGANGLMMAQRYPEDFDGILAGAPPYSWAMEMVMQAWILKALTATPGSALSPAEMDALHAAVVRSCAGPDGLIADPRACEFDPASVRCPAAGFCLRDEQVEAVRRIYRGPQDSRGQPITRGLTRGSEFAWRKLWDVGRLGIDRAGGSWLGVWRYLVFEDPTWTIDRIDFDRDPPFAERKLGALLTQNNPDLAPLARRGGKLIVFHGWGDDMAPAEPTADYHAAVTARMGRDAADQVLRVFMIPGVDHALSGAGAGDVLQTERASLLPLEPERDLLVALQHWVEQGRVPERMIASKFDAQGRLTRTRLLCPEPQVARYAGSGDTHDAANWRCEAR
jgi:feruloyl esterase